MLQFCTGKRKYSTNLLKCGRMQTNHFMGWMNNILDRKINRTEFKVTKIIALIYDKR
jgi:hypothetical protein